MEEVATRQPLGPVVATPLPRVPSWTYAFMLFRLADGFSHALMIIYPVFVLGLPIWSAPLTAAVMNVAAVPGSFAWGALMERTRGVGRRRLAIMGFMSAGVAALYISTGPGFVGFLLAAALFALLGVATAPAESVLATESVPGRDWARVTGRIARRTGIAFLTGLATTAAAGLGGVPVTALAGTAFAATGVTCLVAAATAWWTIEPAAGPTLPRLTARQPGMRRWFERPVWFPRRVRISPGAIQLADGHPRVFLVAIFLVFLASAMLFSAYAGVLAALGLPAGMVLLAQLPSGIVAPFALAWAGQFAHRRGDRPLVERGLVSRLLTVPGICAILLAWPLMGPWAFPILLAGHGLAGLSFAMLHLGAATLVAKSHRGGRGAGMGNFHATVGAGTLTGSIVAFIALAAASFIWLAAAVVTTMTVGVALAMAVRASPHFDERNVAA